MAIIMTDRIIHKRKENMINKSRHIHITKEDQPEMIRMEQQEVREKEEQIPDHQD